MMTRKDDDSRTNSSSRPANGGPDENLIRKNFYVSPEHVRSLRARALEENVSEAAVVRQALDLFFGV